MYGLSGEEGNDLNPTGSGRGLGVSSSHIHMNLTLFKEMLGVQR